MTEDVPTELEHVADYVRELRRLFPTDCFPNHGVSQPDIAASNIHDS